MGGTTSCSSSRAWIDGLMPDGGRWLFSHSSPRQMKEVCADHSPQRVFLSLQLKGQWIDPKQDQQFERIMTDQSSTPKFIWIEMHKHPPVLARRDPCRGWKGGAELTGPSRSLDAGNRSKLKWKNVCMGHIFLTLNYDWNYSKYDANKSTSQVINT